MMSKPIITSLLDCDFYKFLMQQIVFLNNYNVEAEYEFKCRNHPSIGLFRLREEVLEQIKYLSELTFKADEIEYLKCLGFREEYLIFLRGFKLHQHMVQVSSKNTDLAIKIKGPMVFSMMFEIYLLAIISELHSRYQVSGFSEGWKNLVDKIRNINGWSIRNIVEFGTRRRHSKEWHEVVYSTMLSKLYHPDILLGTSNVYLSQKYGTQPKGTMAHEYLQMHQAISPDIENFQENALKSWSSLYGPSYKVALTDVITTEVFARYLTRELASEYTGFRIDSGDPIEQGNKIYLRLKELGVDFSRKTLMFSDDLNIEKCLYLQNNYRGIMNTSFGIGTNLTNDLGLERLQIVIKMTKCNGKPVAKISDSPGKTMDVDPAYIQMLMDTFDIGQQQVNVST